MPQFLTLFNFSLFNWLVDETQSALVVYFGILDLFCFLFWLELLALIELFFQHFVEFFIIVHLHQGHWFLLRPDEFTQLFLLFFLSEVQTVRHGLYLGFKVLLISILAIFSSDADYSTLYFIFPRLWIFWEVICSQLRSLKPSYRNLESCWESQAGYLGHSS